jgi:hypothetical protein
MYICEVCNYKTEYSGNLCIHKKSKKHLYNSNIKNNQTDNNIKIVSFVSANKGLMENYNKEQLICLKCNTSFNHKSSLSRHKKNCGIASCNLENELFKKECQIEILEKEKELIGKIEKEKSELLKDFMANANVLLNKANDNTKITAQAMQTVSVSALKYANDKFKDTPALLPLNNFNINDLSFENDKEQLTETLIYNAKQKSLDKLLGDHIVKCYKKENPEEQSFHTTDCSRLNYIVRDLIEDALNWSVDKNGIKICSSIIKPLIEKCIEVLLEHQKHLIDEMALGNYQNKETVQTIISVLMSIDKGSLESDINKYIAPFFNLNKA